MPPTNDLHELAYHLGLLALQDYFLTIEPDNSLATYLEKRVHHSSQVPSIANLYLDPNQVDLDEHQVNARALRHLEDLLMLGSLPNSAHTSPTTREYLDIFTKGDLANHRRNPTRETLDSVIDQWLNLLNQSGRDFGTLQKLATLPPGYSWVKGLIPYIQVDNTTTIFGTQYELENHLFGLMLIAGRH